MAGFWEREGKLLRTQNAGRNPPNENLRYAVPVNYVSNRTSAFHIAS